jgi:creatinine amidohydrolase
MSDKVQYASLLPHEFRTRMAACPIGYLPMGTLEWHGEHGALGTDALISTGLFTRVAQQFGGIVFPPLFLGPDRIRREPDGMLLQGMDYADTTTPPRQLDGNCYWLPTGLFQLILENIIVQARRAGFKALVADGHGPSRLVWDAWASTWQAQHDIRLISVLRDVAPGWQSQVDHAAQNETSIMQALHPEFVDLSQLPTDRQIFPQGVSGVDPRDATPDYGDICLTTSINLLIATLTTLDLRR